MSRQGLQVSASRSEDPLGSRHLIRIGADPAGLFDRPCALPKALDHRAGEGPASVFAFDRPNLAVCFSRHDKIEFIGVRPDAVLAGSARSSACCASYQLRRR